MTAIAKVSATLLITTALSLSFAVAARPTAAAEHQVDMNAAIMHLRQANTALEHAAADKGGHRDKAMHLITQALHEVEAGKTYLREHPQHH